VKGLLIALAVILLLLVGVDRVADLVAGRYAADRIVEQAPDSGSVAVDFRGFPFLTQAARRRFDRVEVTASGAVARGVRIEELDARLSDARVLSREAVRAGTVMGSAMVSYGELSEAAQDRARVSYGGNGRLKITRTVSVLGRQVSVSAVGRASIRDGVLRVRPERFETDSGPAGDVVRRLPLWGFAVDIALPQLPRGIDVDVAPGETGVELRFSGTDVLLTRSSS
jgi:hypothetical protein